ncbi:hypothetical protein N8I77_001807 [Diaporthe amygdali]|uniref:GP-PDE domain-containing protein n=1 Tax=Phomopsis amygdali TaxID=1214568 RepID=A0AAD9SSE7_PHOAM|nr:hypothetical protein N8I77_001807 [Diaporthe amygdali]
MGEVGITNSALRQRVMDKVQDTDTDTDTDKYGIPPATWTRAQPGINNGFPQAVAHRGYKASFPENTMGAFRGAVDVGAHAIETDVHLSRDGVVVIAHDKDLKRCYGVDKAVRDCDWEYLSTLKTLKEPRQNMCRLIDLLEYLAEPGNESIWVLLDIKIDDAPREMIPRIAATIASAPQKKWEKRIVLGCWRAEHLRLCHELLPDFAITYIGLSLILAREYMKIPNVAINMRQESLFGLGGRSFRERCRAEGRPLYAWTVNKKSWMEWCIGSKVDCVITDDPKLYLEVCDRRRKEEKQAKSGRARKVKAVVTKPRDLVLSVFYLVMIRGLMRVFGAYKRLGYPEEIRAELQPLT